MSDGQYIDYSVDLNLARLLAYTDAGHTVSTGHMLDALRQAQELISDLREQVYQAEYGTH